MLVVLKFCGSVLFLVKVFEDKTTVYYDSFWFCVLRFYILRMYLCSIMIGV